MRLGRFCLAALLGAAIVLAPVSAGAASYFPLEYWLDGDDIAVPREGTVRHYAVQDIRTNDLSAEYFGWKGVKGSIYWAKSAYLPPEANFALGCLSMKTTTNDWLQPGVWQGRDGSLRFYVEWYVAGAQKDLIDMGDATVGSASMASVYFESFTLEGVATWTARINGRTETRLLGPKGTCKPVTQIEVAAQPGKYGFVAPTVYFGTNRASYNGSELALYLFNGAREWELWDETLTAGRTVAHDTESDVHVHYSTGLKCYYWLGRDG